MSKDSGEASMKIKKRCAECNKIFIATQSNQIYCSDKCRYERKLKRNKEWRDKARELYYKNHQEKEISPFYGQSICWECKNSINSGCSWSREFKPVKGWEAKESLRKTASPNFSHSYTVLKCPEFIRG